MGPVCSSMEPNRKAQERTIWVCLTWVELSLDSANSGSPENYFSMNWRNLNEHVYYWCHVPSWSPTQEVESSNNLFHKKATEFIAKEIIQWKLNPAVAKRKYGGMAQRAICDLKLQNHKWSTYKTPHMFVIWNVSSIHTVQDVRNA